MDFIIRDNTEPEVERPEVAVFDGSTRRLCPCGKMFTPYRSFQRFCSEAHRIKYSSGKKSIYVKKPYVLRECKNDRCKKTFRTNDSKRHYCSKECYEEHERNRRVEPEERTCMNCGKTFVSSHWSKRYCSKQCRKEARK